MAGKRFEHIQGLNTELGQQSIAGIINKARADISAALDPQYEDGIWPSVLHFSADLTTTYADIVGERHLKMGLLKFGKLGIGALALSSGLAVIRQSVGLPVDMEPVTTGNKYADLILFLIDTLYDMARVNGLDAGEIERLKHLRDNFNTLLQEYILSGKPKTDGGRALKIGANLAWALVNDFRRSFASKEDHDRYLNEAVAALKRAGATYDDLAMFDTL